MMEYGAAVLQSKFQETSLHFGFFISIAMRSLSSILDMSWGKNFRMKKLHSYIKAEIEFQTSGILHNKRSLLFWFRQSLFSIFKFVHSSSNSFILFSSCYAVECTLFNRITLTISLMILHFEVQLEVFEMMRILSTKWVNHTFENILIAYFSSEMTSVYAIWKLLLKKKGFKRRTLFWEKKWRILSLIAETFDQNSNMLLQLIMM